MIGRKKKIIVLPFTSKSNKKILDVVASLHKKSYGIIPLYIASNDEWFIGKSLSKKVMSDISVNAEKKLKKIEKIIPANDDAKNYFIAKGNMFRKLKKIRFDAVISEKTILKSKDKAVSEFFRNVGIPSY